MSMNEEHKIVQLLEDCATRIDEMEATWRVERARSTELLNLVRGLEDAVTAAENRLHLLEVDVYHYMELDDDE